MVVGKQDNGEYLPLVPADKLTNTLRAEFNNKDSKLKNGFVSFTMESTFKQNKVSQFETPTSSYNVFNLGVGSELNFKNSSLDMNININNLFNKKYISHLSRLKADGIYNIGRNVVLSLRYNL
jgi:iron complex outermembrane receptor protein